MREVKEQMEAVLAKAFPDVQFKVWATADIGHSSSQINWTGAPTRQQVKAVLQPWEHRFSYMKLHHTDPRLLQRFPHLVPQTGSGYNKEEDTENVRRHLAHCFPGTHFDVKGALGPMSNHTSVSVKWTRVGEEGPTKQECYNAIRGFQNTWPHTQAGLTWDDMDFQRIFGSFNYLELEPTLVAAEPKPTVSRRPGP